MVQPFEEGGESGTHSTSLSTSKPNSSVMTQAKSSSSSSAHQLSSSSQAESSSNIVQAYPQVVMLNHQVYQEVIMYLFS